MMASHARKPQAVCTRRVRTASAFGSTWEDPRLSFREVEASQGNGQLIPAKPYLASLTSRSCQVVYSVSLGQSGQPFRTLLKLYQ